MNNDALFPKYIPRVEEQVIREEAAHVVADGQSRVVLLYGPGGIGKTSLIRALAQRGSSDDATVWIRPIDIDDPEYWLLSNLEQQVAEQLDRECFRPYFSYLSRLPAYTRPDIGHETVVSHLGRIKRVFTQCYTDFVKSSGKTVVIAFDTIETMRGMYLLLTLTQWMKALPATLFILSGRPPLGGEGAFDPIRSELNDPHKQIPARVVRLAEFSQPDAFDYLNNSGIATHVSDEEKGKLVLLARGHPLWLAFAVSYLDEKGMPEEASRPLEEVERELPYQATMTKAGQHLHEEFKRRLMTPYRDSDFWHEGIKRLAVVRQSVNKFIWERLMEDQPLPADADSLPDTWASLLQTPWIRPRANRNFVTLHDAVAEELAHRIIPVHDQNEQWRQELWRLSANIYEELTAGPDAELTADFAAVDVRLKDLAARFLQGEQRPAADESVFVAEVAGLDARKRRLDQLKAAGLFYQLLGDFEAGCGRFLDLFEQAKLRHDVLFEDLLALEMQRFLPGGSYAHALGDVIGKVIDEFRSWLMRERPDLYLDIGLSVAEYLINEEEPESALELLGLLDELPTHRVASQHHYRKHILRGNCYMRIPGKVKDGQSHFQLALAEAQRKTSSDGPIQIARAYKELGFYYRNQGMWPEAEKSYQSARDVLSPIMLLDVSPEYREEMASIQTHWGYVKGLVGSYRDGTNLIEAAISIRRRLNRRQELGISLSTCGEVYRYERRFEKAWVAFAEAEQIFHELQNWSWLGLIYQEQAICLYQACQDHINLTGPQGDQIARAKLLITLALDICRDQAVRGYPSALNRAGRIFGADDVEAGLSYLSEAVDWARRLSDSWFLSASLIEYVELSYQEWVRSQLFSYRQQIETRKPEVLAALNEYNFPDLEGRWNLLQGHLAVWDWLDTSDETQLTAALESYKKGFLLIAHGHVGSSGAAAVPKEFETFRSVFEKLPLEIRADWQIQLRREWSSQEQSSILLLARLETLY
jgi:hypothetical protein